MMVRPRVERKALVSGSPRLKVIKVYSSGLAGSLPITLSSRTLLLMEP